MYIITMCITYYNYVFYIITYYIMYLYIYIYIDNIPDSSEKYYELFPVKKSMICETEKPWLDTKIKNHNKRTM